MGSIQQRSGIDAEAGERDVMIRRKVFDNGSVNSTRATGDQHHFFHGVTPLDGPKEEGHPEGCPSSHGNVARSYDLARLRST
ncbi:hypothetical protein SAMN04488092_11077 [Thalassovita taeanensis]|uniref:Uncharacterized protein n=1 Tax=Thalassovita taeanensis TaxID=657014 RepID=A0A1H9HTE3_9RHOB|nr:hypothetical protein SAMN04488092_11077 [Thalassovita taeanensis]